MYIKTKLYVAHIAWFHNILVAICKSKLALKLNKPAYIEMCILGLSNILNYESDYDYIKNRFDKKSKLLFTGADILMYEIKTEDVYEGFSSDKEMFDFSNYSTKSKYDDNSNKLAIGEKKDETGSVAIEEFVGLKAKMYPLLVENSEHKKLKSVSINIVATISRNEHILLNNKLIRHLMNRIQSKDHRIGTYGINKISLSCFDDKIYIQNNRYDRLALGY